MSAPYHALQSLSHRPSLRRISIFSDLDVKAYLYDENGRRDQASYWIKTPRAGLGQSLPVGVPAGKGYPLPQRLTKGKMIDRANYYFETEYRLNPFHATLFTMVMEAVDGETSENEVAINLMEAISKIIVYSSSLNGNYNVPKMFAGVSKEQFKAAYNGTEQPLVLGECIDYASGLAAVLRSIGIPARTATFISYSGFNYHVWTEAYLEKPDSGADHWYVYDAMDYGGDINEAVGASPRKTFKYGNGAFEVIVGGPNWNAQDGGVFLIQESSPDFFFLIQVPETNSGDALFEKCGNLKYSQNHCPGIDPPSPAQIVNISLDKPEYRVGDTVLATVQIINAEPVDQTFVLSARFYRIDPNDDGRATYGDHVLGIPGSGVFGETLEESSETITVPAGATAETLLNYHLGDTVFPHDAFGIEVTATSDLISDNEKSDFLVKPAYELTITTPPSPSSGEPLAIGATVTNVGDFPILNLNLTLDIPVFYDSVDALTFDVALLGEGEQVEFNWDLTPLRPDISSVGYFRVNIISDNGGSQDEPIDLLLQLPPTTGNTSPIARSGGLYFANEGEPVTLDASGSSDPDGTIVLYEWDLDNDGFVDATGVTISVTFDNDGTFPIALRVTDDQGATDTDSADVTVSNVAPDAPLDPDDDDNGDGEGSSSGGGDVGGGGAPPEVPELDVTPVESSSKTITPGAGGIVDTGFGDSVEARVEVSAGALDQDVNIQIEAIPATDPALPPSPAGTLSRTFRFSPSGFQFLVPIFITITYDESEVAGKDENTYMPILLVGNEWVVVEKCTSMLPPIPDPCLVSRDTVNNELTITTTRFSIYGVQAVASDATVIPAAGVATALETLGDNLERVWHFDNPTKEWAFYDARPVFAEDNTLKELVPGEAYLIRIINDQIAVLNGREHRIFAGWNLIGW